jgi:hypothetical protein
MLESKARLPQTKMVTGLNLSSVIDDITNPRKTADSGWRANSRELFRREVAAS